MKTLCDEEQRRGRTLPWKAEGAYRPGEPVEVFISYNDFETESLLLGKNDSGVWTVDDAVYETVGLFNLLGGLEPQVWLRSLL